MQSHGIATPEVGLATSLTSASPNSGPGASTVLVPIVGGSVAINADEAADLLGYYTVTYRHRVVPEQATSAELRAEMARLLAEYGMRGVREATEDCARELRHGHPDDAADVLRWRRLVRPLAVSW